MAIHVGRLTLLAILLLAVTSGCGPSSSDVESARTDAGIIADMTPVERGQAHYLRYCGSCHGQDGLGNGPVAEALKDVPTDVTRFRADHGGDFRTDLLIEIIRGNKDVLAHGTREMPVWGNIWTGPDSRFAQEEAIETRINELVEYIRSIQQ